MKKHLFFIISLAGIASIISCEKEKEESQNEIQSNIINKLSGTWERKSVNYEEINVGETIELTFSEYGIFSAKNISSKQSIGLFKTETGDYNVSKDGRYLETPIHSGYINTNESGKEKYAIIQLDDNTLNLDGIEFVKSGSHRENDVYDKSLILGTWTSTSYHGWDSKTNNPSSPAYHLFSFPLTEVGML